MEDFVVPVAPTRHEAVEMTVTGRIIVLLVILIA